MMFDEINKYGMFVEYIRLFIVEWNDKTMLFHFVFCMLYDNFVIFDFKTILFVGSPVAYCERDS